MILLISCVEIPHPLPPRRFFIGENAPSPAPQRTAPSRPLKLYVNAVLRAEHLRRLRAMPQKPTPAAQDSQTDTAAPKFPSNARRPRRIRPIYPHVIGGVSLSRENASYRRKAVVAAAALRRKPRKLTLHRRQMRISRQNFSGSLCGRFPERT